MLNSTIVDTGAFLPKQSVSTQSLLAEAHTEDYGIPHSAIENEMGIKAIRFADSDMEYSELAALAAENAFNKSHINPNDIDGIIYCGIERDYKEPSTAHNIAKRLGISPALCFDVANACHGFSSGIQIADSLIKTQSCKCILLVTAEMGSRMIRQAIEKSRRKDIYLDNPLQQLGAFSMGDAGGAMIIGAAPSKEKGFQRINFQSQAQYSDLCYYKHVNGILDGRMDMAKICARTISLINKMKDETLKMQNWLSTDIDLLITHQVGIKPFVKILQSLNLTEDRAIKTFPEFGNIASATIPVNFSLLQDSNRLIPEQRVMIISTGSGITVSQSCLIT